MLHTTGNMTPLATVLNNPPKKPHTVEKSARCGLPTTELIGSQSPKSGILAMMRHGGDADGIMEGFGEGVQSDATALPCTIPLETSLFSPLDATFSAE